MENGTTGIAKTDLSNNTAVHVNMTTQPTSKADEDIKQTGSKVTKIFRTNVEKLKILTFYDNVRAHHEQEIQRNGNKETLVEYRSRMFMELYSIPYKSWRTRTLGNWLKSRATYHKEISIGRGRCKNRTKNTSTQGVIFTEPYFDCDQCISASDLDEFTNTLAENIDTIKNSHHTEKINGALQIKIDLLNNTNCAYTKIATLLKKRTKKVLPTSKALSIHIKECINKATANQESKFDLTSLSLVVSDTPQPAHTDVKNEGGNNEQLQGTFMLTDNSEGTTVYDMSGVPMCPTVEDIASVFDKMYPSEILGGENALKMSLLDNTDMIAHAASWGRIMYIDEKRRPKKKYTKKYTMTIMQGNHPHNGPGSNDFRAVIFFTALPRGSNEEHAYGDEQMSKERFIMTIIRTLLPSLKERNDILTIKRLYYAFACAVAESAQYGARDKTLINTKTNADFGAVKFSNLIDKLVRCVEECNKDPNKSNKAIVSMLKDMIGLFIPTKLCEKKDS